MKCYLVEDALSIFLLFYFATLGSKLSLCLMPVDSVYKHRDKHCTDGHPTVIRFVHIDLPTIPLIYYPHHLYPAPVPLHRISLTNDLRCTTLPKLWWIPRAADHQSHVQLYDTHRSDTLFVCVQCETLEMARIIR